MTFTAKVGDTFYLKDKSNHVHLYVVISSEDNNGKIVVVNFTSQRVGKDQTTIFTQRHGWDYFTEPTVVSYQFATIVDRKNLQQHLQEHPTIKGPSCPDDILRVVIEGALKSPNTPNKILEFLKECSPFD